MANKNVLTLLAKIAIALLSFAPILIFILGTVLVQPPVTYQTQWNTYDYLPKFSPNDATTNKQPILLTTYVGMLLIRFAIQTLLYFNSKRLTKRKIKNSDTIN